MTSLRDLFQMNYMTIALQTAILVVWVFFLFPAVIGFAGFSFNLADPVMAGAAFFTGLMISVMTFSLMKYRKGY